MRFKYPIIMLACTILITGSIGIQPAHAQLSSYTWHLFDETMQTPYALALLAHHAELGVTIAAPGTIHDETTYYWDGAAWVNTGQPTPDRATGMVYSNSAETILLYTPAASLEPGETFAWNNGWMLIDSDGPTSRDDCGIAYDSHRDRVVLFGGNYAMEGPQPAYTWEWDGSSWYAIDTTTNGPERRVLTAMAYDAARQEVVLFGGVSDISGDITLYGDTWTWDGATWELAASTGPPARTRHAMTYDPVRERVLLFGGADGLGLPPGTQGENDLWEWDGQAWTHVPVPFESLPFYRYYAAFTWDTTRNQGIMAGGKAQLAPSDYIYLRDLWILDIRRVWVDYAWGGAETGDFDTPVNTLTEGHAATPEDCFLYVKPGSGTENVTLENPMWIDAPLGTVVISGR